MATPTRTPITTAGFSAPGSTVKALVQIATKPDRLSPGYAVGNGVRMRSASLSMIVIYNLPKE